MDDRLLRRGQAVGALLIGVAYFLPWASIMSPLGSVELRGLYVDYAWILLILAILHLLLQFARLNRDALGLPDSSLKYMEPVWRLMPFVFVAFFAWYAVSDLAHRTKSFLHCVSTWGKKEPLMSPNGEETRVSCRGSY